MDQSPAPTRQRVSVRHALRLREAFRSAGESLSRLDLLQPPPRRPLVIDLRESTVEQVHRGNLLHQLSFVFKLLTDHGWDVVAIDWDVGPGWLLNEVHRPGLARAIAVAREVGGGVVALSTDRFLRSFYFGKPGPDRYPDARPDRFDFDELDAMAAGVPLFTLTDPDAEWSEISAQNSSRGQAATGKRGGRPKGRRYQRYTDWQRWEVIRLRRQRASWNQIVKATGVERSTARGWWDAYLAGGGLEDSDSHPVTIGRQTLLQHPPTVPIGTRTRTRSQTATRRESCDRLAAILRLQGLSWNDIAKRLPGISASTFRGWCRRLLPHAKPGVRIPPSPRRRSQSLCREFAAFLRTASTDSNPY